MVLQPGLCLFVVLSSLFAGLIVHHPAKVWQKISVSILATIRIQFITVVFGACPDYLAGLGYSPFTSSLNKTLR
jgi:hypothetical protein